jgi:CheY-like chemotaxis protein
MNLYKPQILLVEDDAINAFVITKFLENEFITTTTSNGFDALELFKTNNFDAVLMDINLGDDRMNGVDLMRSFRALETQTSIPIIAVTAFIMRGDKDKLINSGFNDYLAKPLERTQLLETLHKYIAFNKSVEA